MLYVMLSADLSSAEKQRYDFNLKLKGEGFNKLANVDTVWAKSLEGYHNKEGLVASGLKQLLKKFAIELEIPKLTYVVQIGNNAPLGVIIEDYRGTYRVEDFDPA